MISLSELRPCVDASIWKVMEALETGPVYSPQPYASARRAAKSGVVEHILACQSDEHQHVVL